MRYRYLGGSGLLVSELALGCWVTFEDHNALAELFQITKRAFERGITLFDNAESYGGGRSEEIMDKWSSAASRRTCGRARPSC